MRLKKLTDYTYSPTNPASEDAIRAQIDDAIQEVYDSSSRNDATVNLTGNQSVAGVKTFASSPIVPDPTTDMQAANKKGVDVVQANLNTHKTSTDHDGRYYTETEVNALLLANQQGNHLGTWQGYNPVQTDPGIQNIVNEHTTQLSYFSKYVDEFYQALEVDDTQMLQRAFDWVKSVVNNGEKAKLFLKDNKTYLISSPLDFNFNTGCVFEGRGTIAVSDSVLENNPLTHMINMTEFIAINQYKTGRFVIRDIAFNANNRALKIIDGLGENNIGLYYTYVKDCYFNGIKNNGFGLYGLSFGTTVESCHFVGYGSNYAEPTEQSGTGIYIGESANGLTIGGGNNFLKLTRGIYGNTSTTGKITIKENVFDQTRGAAIYIVNQTALSIENNYFEAICKETESVGVYNNATITGLKPAIVVTSAPSDWSFQSKNISIEKNNFANCPATDVIIADNIYDFKVCNNSITYRATPHNSLVKLLKYGIGYFNRIGSIGLVVSGNALEKYNNDNSSFLYVDNIVDYSSLVISNTLDFATGAGTSKIVVKDFLSIDGTTGLKKLPVNLYDRNFLTDRGFTDFFTTSQERINNQRVFAFLRTASSTFNNFIDINSKYLQRLKGKYVRVSFEVANSQNNAGIRFSVRDGIKTTLHLQVGNQTDKTLTDAYVGINFLFFIDKSATTFGFKIDSFCSAGQTIYIKNFSITPAEYDISEYEELTEDIYLASAPTTGTWSVGDKVFDTVPVAAGYDGYVCVTAGTPGTWKGFGLIQA